MQEIYNFCDQIQSNVERQFDCSYLGGAGIGCSGRREWSLNSEQCLTQILSEHWKREWSLNIEQFLTQILRTLKEWSLNSADLSWRIRHWLQWKESVKLEQWTMLTQILCEHWRREWTVNNADSNSNIASREWDLIWTMVTQSLCGQWNERDKYN